jgi:hypothetical protein
MLFTEVVAVYSENYMDFTITNTVLLIEKASGTYGYRSV